MSAPSVVPEIAQSTAGDGLADYFPFLFPDSRGLAVVLAGYFDESEREEGGEPICVGGYIFKPSGYEKFRKRWTRHVLRRDKFTHFHTTDLCAGRQEYEGLSIAERVAILDEAVDAIQSHAYCGVAIMFDRKEFERTAPEHCERAYGSIYSVACQLCAQAAANMTEIHRRCHLPILYVFERGHKYESHVDAVLKAVGQHEEHRQKLRYRNHLFEDKKAECGLQAADLLVWTATKLRVGGGYRPSIAPWAPSLVKLGTSEGVGSTHILNVTGPTLQRFFADGVRAFPSSVHGGIPFTQVPTTGCGGVSSSDHGYP